MVSIVSKHLHSKWCPTDLLFIYIFISLQTKSTPEFSFTPICLYTSINLTLLIYCMATTQQTLHIWHLLQHYTRNALQRLSTVRLIKNLNALFSACFFIACLLSLSFCLFVFSFVKYWFMVVLLFVLCVCFVSLSKSFLVSWLKCSVLSFFYFPGCWPLLFPL